MHANGLTTTGSTPIARTVALAPTASVGLALALADATTTSGVDARLGSLGTDVGTGSVSSAAPHPVSTNSARPATTPPLTATAREDTVQTPDVLPLPIIVKLDPSVRMLAHLHVGAGSEAELYDSCHAMAIANDADPDDQRSRPAEATAGVPEWSGVWRSPADSPQRSPSGSPVAGPRLDRLPC
ncbi:hypothetical protein [Dactylosporangium salmoneum]|uniref:hypothetical protein n=1 Tax=Dactylosporangium salmoneum TaxID=53361 RepID=UPI0031D1542F